MKFVAVGHKSGRKEVAQTRRINANNGDLFPEKQVAISVGGNIGSLVQRSSRCLVALCVKSGNSR